MAASSTRSISPATERRRGGGFVRPSVIPGFGLTFGFAFACLGLIVLLPLLALFLKAAEIPPAQILTMLGDRRMLAALRVSFGAAFVAALVNVVFGLITAWVLVRYRFPFRRLFDAIVDLPFALPTAVAGVTLSSLYAQSGWVGGLLAPFGIKIAYAAAGIVVALIFVGLPFVVRTVQPVIEELDREQEEAAATLGARRLQTLLRVVLPRLLPAILAGFALAFARAVGEYGSVIFIAGNIPFVSEIAPLLIVIRLQEFNVAAAALVGAIMLVLSLLMLLVINLIQFWSRRRFGDVI
jgi:sulfate transport system permease protein